MYPYKFKKITLGKSFKNIQGYFLNKIFLQIYETNPQKIAFKSLYVRFEKKKKKHMKIQEINP